MRIPVIRGVIDRRILVNYRVDPDALGRILPEPFRPKLIRGFGVAGICLIRLKKIRPWFVPSRFGMSSENAAHRIAVEWEQDGQMRQGVYIPRRDTSSRINTLVGGRLFPGVHHHARFQVEEHEGRYELALDSDDGKTHLLVHASTADRFAPTRLFASLQEASDFFERGSLGYSATQQAGRYDGLELRTLSWRVEPLTVQRVESSFFEDSDRFPAGSANFDCGLLMRGIDHEWHGRETLCAECGGSTALSDRHKEATDRTSG